MSFRSFNNKTDIVYNNGFTSMTIDTLFKDRISIRAILIDKNKVWYGADNSRFGCYDLDKKKNSKSIFIAIRSN